MIGILVSKLQQLKGNEVLVLRQADVQLDIANCLFLGAESLYRCVQSFVFALNDTLQRSNGISMIIVSENLYR